MNGYAKWLRVWLAVVVAGLGTGCETVQENSLTANLWHKDPCASIEEQAQGHDYLYSSFSRTTLTPFTLVGDVTIIGVAIGAGCLAAGTWEAFKQASQDGGKITR